MTTHWQDHDEDDDDQDWDGEDAADANSLSAAELPDLADTDAGDDATTVPCPFCRRPVYEFADVCPGCHNFIGGTDDPTAHASPWRRKPAWYLLGLVLCVVILLGYAVSLVRMW